MADVTKIMQYLHELKDNNNRDFFHASKEERKEAEMEFEMLLEELEFKIAEFDDSITFYPPQELTFKQVRDTRYSKDKSPYNPAFRAHIAPKGKLPVPVGYYLSLKPDNESFIGGGLFADMFTQAVSDIRDYIYQHSLEFNEIINDKEFAESFQVMGKKLKNVPKIYEVDSPAAEYLKHKSWYLEHAITDRDIISNDNLVDYMSEKFRLMKDFNHFLNRALVNFKMPERRP